MITIEGKIVNEDSITRGRIEIDPVTGLISRVSEPTGTADIVLNEELIFPGFVDIHTHARECIDHSQDYKEDFNTAGEAGINGGVTAIAEMPNNPTPPIDDASYEEKKKLSEKSPIEVVLYAGIGPNTKPLSSTVPYKAFMGPSVGDLFFHSNEELEEVIKEYAGQNISFHCEDPEILEEKKEESAHEERRPKEAEMKAVDFAIYLILKYNLVGKICHASTKESIGKIKSAKERDVNVRVEVSPHHLYFDYSIVTEEMRPWVQMNPPLRSKEDKVALITALRDGTIDFLATDHAPHTEEEKMKGTSGTPQLDTYGLVTTWLMKEHNFSPTDIVRICSKNPGDFINNFTKTKYGKIEEGYTGSLTVIDMEKPTKVEKEMLKTKCGWSPFLGITFPGRVTITVVKGKIYEKQ